MLPKKPALPKPPTPTSSVKSPMKMGSTAVKTPKTKKLPGALDKPSVFFKTEGTLNGVDKLRAFLSNIAQKRVKI